MRRSLTLLYAILLAACGPQATAPASPTPSAPPAATAASATTAPTATAAAGAMPEPTEAPAPTPSAEPSQLTAGQGWRRYEYAEAGFGVELPAAPDVQRDSASTLIGPIDTLTATVQLSPTRVLRAVATRYPQRLFELDDIGGLNTIAAARESLLRDAPARGLSERVVFVGQSPGHELLVSPGADGFFMRAQLFIVGRTLFQLALRDTQAPLDAAAAQSDADRFFGSLALTAPPPVTQGWQPVALGDAFCSIWLPGQPAKSARQIETGVGPLDRVTYALDQPERGLRLLVSATAYPPQALREGDEAVERELDRARDGALLEVMGGQPDESHTYYGEVRGRELRVVTPDGGFAIVRLYMLGSVLYELTLRSANALPAPAEGGPSVPSGDEVGRFFLTFEPR
jgi:hypothetical protein